MFNTSWNYLIANRYVIKKFKNLYDLLHSLSRICCNVRKENREINRCKMERNSSAGVYKAMPRLIRISGTSGTISHHLRHKYEIHLVFFRCPRTRGRGRAVYCHGNTVTSSGDALCVVLTEIHRGLQRGTVTPAAADNRGMLSTMCIGRSFWNTTESWNIVEIRHLRRTWPGLHLENFSSPSAFS